MSLEDKAQEHEAMVWSLVNAPRPERPTFKPGEPGYGPAECDDCGEDMPELRRTDGRRCCTPCTSERERRALVLRR
jgi:formylmethanofuran dehydrogenase subunit E